MVEQMVICFMASCGICLSNLSGIAVELMINSIMNNNDIWKLTT